MTATRPSRCGSSTRDEDEDENVVCLDFNIDIVDLFVPNLQCGESPRCWKSSRSILIHGRVSRRAPLYVKRTTGRSSSSSNGRTNKEGNTSRPLSSVAVQRLGARV